MNTEPTLPPMPEVDLPEGDWFEKELYVKKFATGYAKAALAAAKQAQAEQAQIQIVPTDAQLSQLLDGLDSCYTEQSVEEFLRVWIRDLTVHKLSMAGIEKQVLLNLVTLNDKSNSQKT